MNPYSVRAINVTIQLGKDQQQIALTNHRISAQITNAIFPASASATIIIYGLRLDLLNQITRAGLSYLSTPVGTNTVFLSAGDASGMASIFKGNIINAYPDGSRQPDMPFVITATPNVGLSMPPATPTSFPGPTPLQTVLQQITAKAGLTVQNNGVNITLTAPYFSGSIFDQIKDAVHAADCYCSLDAVGNQIIITPKTGATQTRGNVVFSPANGMIGYPAFEANSIIVRSLFDQTLVLFAGDVFKVQSQFTAANGSWHCSHIDYDLESQTPDGHWEMIVKGWTGQDPGTGNPAS